MAKSPAHQFGQIIGEVLEASVESLLHQFAEEHELYLDKKGSRSARKGKKASWLDVYGNKHDLDFVLERGGSDTQIGTPVAFIETAWRRYTKHSRNKAQEIQGAILPLVETHRNAAPFAGVVLAGYFTDAALTQLRSLGFSILYFPYETVVEVFQRAGIDARFDEQTPDAEFAERVNAWKALPVGVRAGVAGALVELNAQAVQRFMDALRRAVSRQIESIRVLPLHGRGFEWEAVEDAIGFIENYDEDGSGLPVVRYEIQIRYSTGERIEGQFLDKETAIQFLRSYQPPPLQPAQ